MAVLDFDRAGLVARLAALPDGVRVMFAAILAERMLPAAAPFLGTQDPVEAEHLARAIDVLWRRGGGEAVNPGEAKSALARCEALLDVAAEADTNEALLAENLAAVVAFGLRALLSGDPADLGRAAQRAYDTADHVAVTQDPVEHGPRDEARILAHPVVQQEIARQTADVGALEAAARGRSVRPAEVAKLRQAARAQGASFLAPEGT